MVKFAQRHGELVVHFDQCMTGANSTKTTQLLCSSNVINAVRRRLGRLVCNHPAGTHDSIVGRNDSDLGFKTKPAENFTPELNRHLAEAMLEPSDTSRGWVDTIGAYIMPFTNRLVDSFNYLAAFAASGAAMHDESTAAEFVSAIAGLVLELPPEERCRVDLSEVMPIACTLRR